MPIERCTYLDLSGHTAYSHCGGRRRDLWTANDVSFSPKRRRGGRASVRSAQAGSHQVSFTILLEGKGMYIGKFMGNAVSAGEQG